ncbi:hypothetical protein TRVA0_042S00606 [Trichomonascus vanleenenianus]|uniref:uncharacterized protein n=1 Tax=Trichomonascus vanleenenianus TaxID=2268995 RepID=UPI003ECB9CB0
MTQELPSLPGSLPFEHLVCLIELSIADTVDSAHPESAVQPLIKPLVAWLIKEHNNQTEYHPGIVAALLIARSDFEACNDIEDDEDEDYDGGFAQIGVSNTRALAAELIAVEFMNRVPTDKARIALLTYECRGAEPASPPPAIGVSSPLASRSSSFSARARSDVLKAFALDNYEGSSALEIAVVHRMGKFLCSPAVESILNRIWNGRIAYWNDMDTLAKKSAHINKDRGLGNMFVRLRVPQYRAFFMMLNYAILLLLFYTFLFRPVEGSLVETCLHVWFLGIVVDEIMQVRQASSLGHYAIDYWSIFDLTIIAVYLAFLCLRVAGMVLGRSDLTQMSFDVLSLEALMLVPRLFSFLSIYPYFGTLLPCLKELTKEFIKFSSLILIIYLGFFTTFSFLGRDSFTINRMFWLLISVFFGSSYAGFEASSIISPTFGPSLMLIFVTLTNILLVTVLVSILSNKFSVMMLRAREEYVLLFASTVVESISTATDRLTYFYPPLNLIGLAIRPFRLLLTHDQYRAVRIIVIKTTHWPFALSIACYEWVLLLSNRRRLRRRNKRGKSVVLV